MKRTLTIGLIALAAGVLTAGCASEATVDARSLTGMPLPPGRMAVLPVILTDQVQDHTLAGTFVLDVVGDLKKAGLDVEATDLGGKVSMRVLPSRPVTKDAPEAKTPGDMEWMSLPASQRAERAKGTGFATVCQPVVLRYGRYAVYVPPQVITYDNRSAAPQAYAAYTEATATPTSATVEVADRGGGRGGGGRGGFRGRFEHFGGWPWLEGDYYMNTYVPGHYEPGAQIRVAFHIFDAATGQRIYYIVATNSGVSVRAPELEPGFERPLAEAFGKAMGPAKR